MLYWKENMYCYPWKVIYNIEQLLNDSFAFMNLSEPDDANTNIIKAARMGIIAGIVSHNLLLG